MYITLPEDFTIYNRIIRTTNIFENTVSIEINDNNSVLTRNQYVFQKNIVIEVSSKTYRTRDLINLP